MSEKNLKLKKIKKILNSISCFTQDIKLFSRYPKIINCKMRSVQEKQFNMY